MSSHPVQARDEAYARERREINRTRLRVLAPIMVVVHLAHIVRFRGGLLPDGTLPEDVRRWYEWAIYGHIAPLPVVAFACWVLFRSRSPRLLDACGPGLSLVYLWHGAYSSCVDQLRAPTISVYIGYCFGVAVTTSLTRRTSLIVFVLGALGLFGGLVVAHVPPAALGLQIPAAATVTVFCIALAWVLEGNRVKAFEQRLIIDRQRDELKALNAELEERVQLAVAEVVRRADEVERLNAQLRAQVQERSEELSLALARLERVRAGDQALERGALLGGRFTIGDQVGRGGMGAVYAAVDESSGSRVAIKVIQADSTDQIDLMRRFIREAGTAARVSHPAVVRMLHVDVTDGGLLYQAQELVEGVTLTKRIGKPWPPAAAARLVSVLCEALAAAHKGGVIHRDVKPANVMLTATGAGLKLLDFGIARLYGTVARADATAARRVIGTPGYMAPEQATGEQNLSDKVDVYAAGVILFLLLTGRLPSRAVLSAPTALADVVALCLSADPAERPSAAELAALLGRFADEEGAPPLVAIAAAPAEDPRASIPSSAASAEATLIEK